MLPHLASLLVAYSTLLTGADSSVPLHLKDGDRIVLVGGTMIEREQRYGYWETALTLLHPELNLQFRNLGWSGDTVYGDSRAGFGTTADGYRLLKEQITAANPTVLLIAYGANEAFDGPAGLPRFKEGMRQFLHDLAPLSARVVLLAPMEQIHPATPVNENIRAYTEQIKELALEERLGYRDLFAALRNATDAERKNWTDDGIHLNAEGYRHLAPGFCSTFAGPKTMAQPPYNLEVKGIQLPALFDLKGAHLARSTEGFVTIDGLAPGKYQLILSENLATPNHERLVTATDAEWKEGKAIRFDFKNGQFDTVRKAVVAKNGQYFNRYRPENETYLFGFRKHEQGQNAAEVSEFDKLVAEAEEQIAELRKPILRMFVVIRVDR